jgi:hypothetical protein
MCHAVVLSRRGSSRQLGLLVMTAAVTIGTGGCRTSSWTAPSSWSMFSSQPKNADKLAAGVAAPGDLTKPSATAQPYPTTSTPQSYSLAGGTTAPPAGGVAQAGASRTNDMGPVVYGSTPPAASTAPPALAAAPTIGASPPAGPPLSTISPQVGPYAPSSSAAPGGFAAAAAPPAAMSPELPPFSATPPERLAENQPSFPAAAGASASGVSSQSGPSWGGASADALAGESRYATGASRFSSPADAAPAASSWPTPPPAQTTPGADPSTGFQPLLTPPPATEIQPPAAVPTPPEAQAPGSQTPAFQSPGFQPQPAAPPSAIPAATPPARRPDPGYRPGGTSSYRPGADILNDRSVQPVSFGMPAPPPAVPQ